jgi:peptide deformylase
MKKILQYNEKPARTTVQSGGVLREIAKDVPLKDIKAPKIKKVLKEMSASLASQHDGVAIAAPQIGYSLRIFVVSGKIFAENFAEERKHRLESAADKAVNENNIIGKNKEEVLKDLVFINPKISKLSREKEWVPEGCLSVRPLYGKTYRSKKALVTAYDENGKKFTRGGSGLLAQIFQHETDHLDGILFIDHAKEVRAEEIKEY